MQKVFLWNKFMLKIIFKYSLWCAVLWTAVIFGLCCMPGKYIPTNDWLELLSVDKLVHASIFFGLTCLWLVHLYKLQKVNTVSVSLVIISCVSYGGLLEIMQATLFSQRSADWLDFIANSFGCLMGLLFYMRKKDLLNFEK